MFSKTYRVAAILVVAVLVGGILAGTAQVLHATYQSLGGSHVLAPTAVVVYSQPPSPAGGLIPSALRDPEGSDTDQWAWDGFTIGWTQVITEVQWRGAYDPALLGSGGLVHNFTVDIYASIASGSQPDVSNPPLVHHEVGGNANETPAGVLGGVQTYDYRFELPAPFEAAARTKYWVQIEAYQTGAPDWALVKATGGDGVYFRDNGYIQQLAFGDAAFTLLAPGILEADLAVSKVDAVDPVMEGDDIVYTVTVSNAGPEPARNVVLSDQLPAGVIYGSAVPSQGTCGQSAGVVTCNLGDISASGSASVVVTVTSTGPGTVTNSVSVISDTMDPNETNNSASEDTVVNAVPVPEADLAIAKVDDPDPVNAGAVLTYTLTITNNGPDPATAVTVTDTLPVEVTYGGASGAGWTCGYAGGEVTCTQASLGSGVTSSVGITVTVPGSGGILANTATVTSTTADPNLSNNTDTEQTTVNPPGVAQADLAIAKVDTPDPVSAGAVLTYTLTITNSGPDPATAVTVTDSLPVEVTYGGTWGTGWTCGYAGGEVTCTRASLGSGLASSIGISVTAPGTSGMLINTASASAQETDPNQGNNSAQVTTQVRQVYYVYLPLVSR